MTDRTIGARGRIGEFEQPERPAGGNGVGPDDRVWLAVLPAAALVLAAVVWLAPPLARFVYPAPSWKPFPSVVQVGLVRPERVEQTRYLVAAVGPLVVVAVWLALRRWYRPRRWKRVATWYVLVLQLAIAALVAACWVAQKRAYQWFGDWTLVVAIGMGLGLILLARRGWIVPTRPGSELRRARRLVGLGIAILVTGYWLLPAVYRTPNAVSMARFGELGQIEFVQDELVSVLNGRTPMVNFASQYSKLLPVVLAPVLAAFSPSIGVTTGVLAALGLLGLLSVYGIFVVLTEDSLAALVLYVPFLALSLFTWLTDGDERINLATLFGVVPIRILGPFVLGWLCARQLRRGNGGAPVLLFAGAGLVAINNTEFGAASFVALALALWCGHDGQTSGWARAQKLAVQATVGGAISVIGACIFTLLRSGSLPNIGYVTNLTRVFAIEGFGMEPIRPTLGLHLVIYLTFVVALLSGVIGAVRSSQFSTQARVMRGLLAYSGLLGLGAATYWVGRSTPSALFGMFPTWGLAVAILCWAVLREAAAHPKVSPELAVRWALPTAGVLVAFGLMMTVVVQIPSPVAQLRRFTADGSDVPQYAASVRFIADRTVRGERVAILTPVGHLLALDAGIVNVSPYATEASIAFYEQMDLVLGAMREEGATKVFLKPTWPEISV